MKFFFDEILEVYFNQKENEAYCLPFLLKLGFCFRLKF